MAYSKAQLDKIGNLLIYITDKVGPTYKTKLLKLVYIIEEEYMKQAGVPLTPLSFTHLPKGPVSTFVNKQIDKRRDVLGQYINFGQTELGCRITPKVNFNDDEFSDFDLEVIDDVLNRFGGCTADDLIEYTHREGSLWDQMNREFDGSIPADKRTLDMSKLLDGDDIDPALRESANEHKAFIQYLTTEE